MKLEEEGNVSETCAVENGKRVKDGPHLLCPSSIRKMVSKVVAEGMWDFKSEV